MVETRVGNYKIFCHAEVNQYITSNISYPKSILPVGHTGYISFTNFGISIAHD